MEGFHGHFSSVGLHGRCRWGGGALHACDGLSLTVKQQRLCAHICTENSLAHMHGDKAASAWVAYIKPFVGSADGKEAAVQSEIAALCDEHADVFEQPGLPVHHDVDHRIDLHDETAKPPRPRQYRLSAAENAEV